MDTRVMVLLHNVRSAHNVGAIFRSAEGAGVSAVWLCGYTPAPVDRFGRPRPDVAKAALGAECVVPWKHFVRAPRTIAQLRTEGWQVVAVEQAPRARDYRAFRARGRVCFVFGNEVRGLSKRVRAVCDETIHIPMRGSKESLNVAVAAGVVLFSILPCPKG